MHGFPDRVYQDQSGAAMMEVNLGKDGMVTMPRGTHDQFGAEAEGPEDYRRRITQWRDENQPRNIQEEAALASGLVGPGTGAPSLESARRQGLIDEGTSGPVPEAPAPHVGSGDDNITTAAGNEVEGGNQPGDRTTPGSEPAPDTAPVPAPEQSPAEEPGTTPTPESTSSSEQSGVVINPE